MVRVDDVGNDKDYCHCRPKQPKKMMGMVLLMMMLMLVVVVVIMKIFYHLNKGDISFSGLGVCCGDESVCLYLSLITLHCVGLCRGVCCQKKHTHNSIPSVNIVSY